MATKKREIIDSAVSQIIRHVDKKHGGQDGKPTRKPNPLGVPLDQAEIDQLTEIAQELGQKRHHVMQYAIRQFLADWRAGKRPELKAKTVYTLEPD